jgi:hypothetical protein
VPYLVVVVFAVIYGYVAYAAIAISRTLSNGVYRNQALGLAVIALVMISFATWLILGPPSVGIRFHGPPSTGLYYVASFLGSWEALFIGSYYYVDASIMAARPTDPLFRDTLHWSRMRVAFWVYDIAVAVVFTITGAVGSYEYGSGSPLVDGLISLPLLIVLFSGAVVLPIAAKRSKDKVLKKQLNWFVVYVIAAFVPSLFVGSSLQSNIQSATLGLVIVWWAFGYFLYKSTISLVPLYRFETSPRPSSY